MHTPNASPQVPDHVIADWVEGVDDAEVDGFADALRAELGVDAAARFGLPPPRGPPPAAAPRAAGAAAGGGAAGGEAEGEGGGEGEALPGAWASEVRPIGGCRGAACGNGRPPCFWRALLPSKPSCGFLACSPHSNSIIHNSIIQVLSVLLMQPWIMLLPPLHSISPPLLPRSRGPIWVL